HTPSVRNGVMLQGFSPSQLTQKGNEPSKSFFLYHSWTWRSVKGPLISFFLSLKKIWEEERVSDPILQ
ncbi:hypothetical protein PMAYCL1PPCAC_20045, partial [Pristionchus mayeri]